MTSQEAMMALNMLEKVGPITVRRLLEEFETPEKILTAGQSRLTKIPGIGPEIASSITNWESQIDLKKEVANCESFGCHVFTQLDESYPEPLRQIYDPPIVLYVKGEIQESDRTSIALVGSRITSNYGRETARKLAYQLGMADVTVVSGGARGIDSGAHQGALSAKGRTLCILGNGINRVYPQENQKLFEQIIEHGAILTEFPFDRPPSGQNFPIRNRIVAGISLGVVVVEAGAKSGALITANQALDCGKLVFAVPGPVYSPRSKGCHNLIKNGAKLCENAEDILSEFEYLFPPAKSEASEPPSLSSLSDSERKLYKLLCEEDLHVDELVRQSGFSVPIISVALLQLEMKRLIEQTPGNNYSALKSRPL